MSAKFEIKIAKNGEYMFNLYAPNGRVICTSETYTALHNCHGGIESVRANAAAPIEELGRDEALPCPKYEVFTDKAGEYRFHLKAKNGEIVCASQGYTTRESCYGGIRSVGENAPIAEILEATDLGITE